MANEGNFDALWVCKESKAYIAHTYGLSWWELVTLVSTFGWSCDFPNFQYFIIYSQKTKDKNYVSPIEDPNHVGMLTVNACYLHLKMVIFFIALRAG